RHGADGVSWRTADDPRTYGEVNQRVVLLVQHPENAGGLKDDARLLGEHFLIVRQLRHVDIDGAGLAAGNREIRRVFIETKRLAPSAFPGLRDVAGHAQDPWIVKIHDTHLIVGREKIKCRADATQLIRPCKSRDRNEEYRR